MNNFGSYEWSKYESGKIKTIGKQNSQTIQLRAWKSLVTSLNVNEGSPKSNFVNLLDRIWCKDLF